MGRRGLQTLLITLGCVALVFGALGMVMGAGFVPGPGGFSPNIDSEFRFFATWYAIVGFLILRAVPNLESQASVIRALSVGAFLAGCTRAVSWVVVGTPDQTFVVLMAIELAIPFVVLPWLAAVIREARPNGISQDVRRAL
ncbi:MAG TPA: DUF4345 domain-containing protein [Actinomycetota bacterium]|nr:DUF4345 domain-containing protein [Actinomycetota bacterium]